MKQNENSSNAPIWKHSQKFIKFSLISAIRYPPLDNELNRNAKRADQTDPQRSKYPTNPNNLQHPNQGNAPTKFVAAAIKVIGELELLRVILGRALVCEIS